MKQLYCKCWIEYQTGRKLFYNRYDIDTNTGFVEVFFADSRAHQWRQVAFLIAPNQPTLPPSLPSTEEWYWERGTHTATGIERAVLKTLGTSGAGYWCIYDSNSQSVSIANTVLSSQPFKSLQRRLNWDTVKDDKLRERLESALRER
jgi:hypothetical protein